MCNFIQVHRKYVPEEMSAAERCSMVEKALEQQEAEQRRWQEEAEQEAERRRRQEEAEQRWWGKEVEQWEPERL